MNKAAREKLLAEEMASARPGIMSALIGVVVMLSAAVVVAASIYGLMYAIQHIDTRASLIGTAATRCVAGRFAA